MTIRQGRTAHLPMHQSQALIPLTMVANPPHACPFLAILTNRLGRGIDFAFRHYGVA